MAMADGGFHQPIENDHWRRDGKHQAQMRKRCVRHCEKESKTHKQSGNADDRPNAVVRHGATIACVGGARRGVLFSVKILVVLTYFAEAAAPEPGRRRRAVPTLI